MRPVKRAQCGGHSFGKICIKRPCYAHHSHHALSLRRGEIDEFIDGLIDTPTVQVAQREADHLGGGVGDPCRRGGR